MRWITNKDKDISINRIYLIFGNYIKNMLFFIDLPGYLVSFLTWLFLWPGACTCIGGFETKSLPIVIIHR